ncbi:MAG: asparagine synthase (glutamine-hydrolyzing) [Bacteroidetes bacterium]|nr:asparagine synthase (glutamine-hydrolyzing) [Bacteroidota bacterium]
MCGIAGIINMDNTSVNTKIIKNICDIISHRGPDAEGFYYGKQFALGHRRLSILDLSVDGSQPMSYKDYVIVFNGEIYNYIEIKDELLKAGYTFHTKTDTEVILASYDYWKQGCVNKFNGMWSFCIYDIKKNILFCSRDRYGVKPFYYSSSNGQFVFGSEIKQIIYFFKERVANTSMIVDFLLGYDEHNTTETFYENVLKLPASHNLVYNLSEHSYKVYKYYELTTNEELKVLTEEHAISLIEQELKRSIRIRMRSDVRVGTCLSGGLDSSTIATYASQIYEGDKKFSAIHAKSIEKENDESEFAQKVALSSDLDFIVIEPGTDSFFEVLNKVIEIHEEPFSGPSVYMQYFVFKEAKANDCIVMLDGQGGDEVFLGYERYYLPTLKYLSLKKRIQLLYKLPNYTRLSYRDIAILSVYYALPKLYIQIIKRKSKHINSKYIKKASFNLFEENISSYKNIDELQKAELFKFVLPQLLKVEDKNSMYHSVESRLPFLDYKLIETVYSINNKYKINNMWSKYLMRKMIQDKLPKEIVWRRKKIGFAAPSNKWLSNKDIFLKSIKESKIVNTVLNGIPENLDNGLLWKLYTISIWERTFNIVLKD